MHHHYIILICIAAMFGLALAAIWALIATAPPADAADTIAAGDLELP